VVLKGNNTAHLTNLATEAGNLGLPSFSVQDAGKTQVDVIYVEIKPMQCFFGSAQVRPSEVNSVLVKHW